MASYYSKDYEEPKDALVESSLESSEPAVDYSDSPFYEGNTDTDSGLLEDEDDEEKKKQEQQSEPEPTAPTETARVEAANNGLSYTDTAVANVTGQQPATWNGDYSTLPQGLSRDEQIELYYQLYPEARPQTTQEQATAPAESTQPQNQILPSAGDAKYQADNIYDPSKTYGRQPDGSYVFSNSARELQNNLAREGYYKGAIDGYFGQQTQEALDAYLSEHGIKTEPNKGPDTLVQAAQEAPKAETPSNTQQAVQNTIGGTNQTTSTANPATPTPGTSSSKPAHDDAWYAEQYEKITGDVPRTDILSPERIRSFVDEQLAKQRNQPVDIDESAKQAWEAREAEKQEKIDALNARRDAAFTPQFINDLRNGKSVEQILGEGDLSYNRWIQDNWDDLAYTYNLGNQSPFESTTSQREPINYDAMADELFQMDRNDWYQNPVAQREPINYSAMLDELNQMDRNDWYQRPAAQQTPARTPIEYSDAFTRQEDMKDAYSPNQTFNDNYRAELERQQNEELKQLDRRDSYFPDLTKPRTPIEYSDAFIRQQDMNDAYSPNQTFNDNYMAELERLQQMRGEVFGTQRNGSVPERYISPRQPLEYSDAFIRQEEMKDAYSPYQSFNENYMTRLERMRDEQDISNPDTIASDDIQSSSNRSEEQSLMDAYNAAMQSARRARDIFQGLPTETEQIQQTREQWSQNQKNALEQQIGPYMKQFQQDYAQLKQQFPNYSDTALMDMVLFNEEMRNGQSSYYKWLANSLG